jgi:hypothetical protein
MTISVSGQDVIALNGGKVPRWELTVSPLNGCAPSDGGRAEFWYIKNSDPRTLLGGPRIAVLNSFGRSLAERYIEFEFSRGVGYPGPYVTQYVKSISGNVQIDAANAERTVRLYRRSDGGLVATTQSDPITGNYTFYGLKAGEEYDAQAIEDTELGERIYDRVLPV